MSSRSKSLIRRIGASLFPMLFAAKVIPSFGPEAVFTADPSVSLLKRKHFDAQVSMLLNNYRQRAESKMRKEWRS